LVNTELGMFVLPDMSYDTLTVGWINVVTI